MSIIGDKVVVQTESDSIVQSTKESLDSRKSPCAGDPRNSTCSGAVYSQRFIKPHRCVRDSDLSGATEVSKSSFLRR